MIDSFVAIDFETLYVSRISVCSMALVKFVDKKVADEFYTLIQPDWNALTIYENTHTFEYIHHIKNEELMDKPTFPEVVPIAEKITGNLPLVAHNAAFERSCFRALCQHYNIVTTLPYEQMYDTLKLTRDVEHRLHLRINGKGTHTLNTLAKMYETTSGTHHNALDDSIDCGNLFIKEQELLEMSDEEIKNVHLIVPKPIIEIYSVPDTVTIKQLVSE